MESRPQKKEKKKKEKGGKKWTTLSRGTMQTPKRKSQPIKMQEPDKGKCVVVSIISKEKDHGSL